MLFLLLLFYDGYFCHIALGTTLLEISEATSCFVVAFCCFHLLTKYSLHAFHYSNLFSLFHSSLLCKTMPGLPSLFSIMFQPNLWSLIPSVARVLFSSTCLNALSHNYALIWEGGSEWSPSNEEHGIKTQKEAISSTPFCSYVLYLLMLIFCCHWLRSVDRRWQPIDIW